MTGSRSFAAVALLCTLSLSAQTYQPKALRIDGVSSADQAEAMRLIALKPGAAVSRQEIEAAMQRLADSGLFADLSYTVNPEALTFVVKPVAGSQAQQVRFSNFVWWQPGELEPLVESRVPLYHGTLPVTGQLTAEVERTLVAMLAEKGVPGARVEAMQSRIGEAGLALTIVQPSVTLGAVRLEGTAPEAAEQIRLLTAQLATRDFDAAESPATIVHNAEDAQRDAGYLDATVDPPMFSPPQKGPQGYTVSATATIHPSTKYHLAAVSYDGVDAKYQAEVAKAAAVKVGDPAGEMQRRISEGLAARALQNHGLLEAKADAAVTRDAAQHTVTYVFHVHQGPIYTLASVDVTALSPEAQTRFNKGFHVTAGQVADASVRTAIGNALNAVGVLRSVAFNEKLDRGNHTVTYVIVPRRTAAAPAQS